MSEPTNWAAVLTKQFLEKELAAGRGPADVARTVGCTANTVRSYLLRHRLVQEGTDRPADQTLIEAYERLGNIRAVASSLKVPYSTAREWLVAAEAPLKRPRPPGARAEFDVAEAARRYTAGEGYQAIADDLGISVKTLRDRLLGESRIEPRPRGRPRSGT